MPTINGTDQSDIINGTAEGDIINGLGGNDTIAGGAGDDTINGGEGNDTLNGQEGNDSLYGDGGNDILFGSNGDQLYGGDGDDRFEVSLGAAGSGILLNGGEGHDIFNIGFPLGVQTSVAVNLVAGAGDDVVLFTQGTGNTIDLGSGNDRIVINGSRAVITLGEGRDEVALGFWSYGISVRYGVANVITDYQPGTDYVTIPWNELFFDGWNGSRNPFAEGFVRVVQDGADAVLQHDADGSGGNFGFSELLRFKNVSAASLTAADLGGFDPNGAKAPGLVLTGTELNDPIALGLDYRSSGLVGGVGDDVISGLGGHDVLAGMAGNDILYGGAGNDNLNGGVGDDELYGGPGDDTLVDAVGSDKLYGEGGNDSLHYIAFGSGNVLLDGGDGNDQIAFLPGPNSSRNPTATIIGGAGDDTVLIGGVNSTGNVINLGEGNDTVKVTGKTNVTIDGGPGMDTAVYSGLFRSYQVQLKGAAGSITGGAEGGTSALTSIEFVKFKDGTFVFDANGVAAQVTRLYDTVLRRAPDQAGLDLWVDLIEDRGGTLKDVARGFLNSVEFQAKTGNLSNADYVEFLYVNALGRASDPDGKAYWVEQLSIGADRADLLIGFSESQEHRNLTAVIVSQGFFNTDDAYQAISLIYDSFAGRKPDAGGLIYWAELLKSGTTSLDQIADGFAASPEFQNLIAGKSNADLVEFMYNNTLDRGSDPGGKAHWISRLESGMDHGDLLIGFSQSTEHFIMLGSTITNGIDHY